MTTGRGNTDSVHLNQKNYKSGLKTINPDLIICQELVQLAQSSNVSLAVTAFLSEIPMVKIATGLLPRATYQIGPPGYERACFQQSGFPTPSS